LGFSPEVLADHGKIDTVVLENGDRVTCEILEMKYGRLTCKTDPMGTLTIEWVRIRRVVSSVRYEIETVTGQRMLGSLESTADGQLTIRTAGGDVSVDLKSVAQLQPMDSGFWRRLDGSIDLGFSFSEANQLIEWSLDAAASRRTPKTLTQASLDSMLSLGESTDRQTRNTVTLVAQRFVSANWFVGALAQFSQNEELGLDFRSVAGGGVGRYLWRSSRTELSGMAGGGYTREQFVDQPGDNRAEAFQAVRWDWFSFGHHDVVFTNSLLTFEGAEDGVRLRLELNSQAQFKIVKDLHYTLSLVESFDSSPPDEQKENDLAVTASLGWSF